MVVKASQDLHVRKSLLQMEVVHAAIEVALTSCREQDSQGSALEEQGYAKDAVAVLCNLANFDKAKFYIPGETVRQEKDLRKFLLWGGLLALYYVGANAKTKEVIEFCEATKLTSLDLRYQEDLVKVLRAYLNMAEDARQGDTARAAEGDLGEGGNSQEEAAQPKTQSIDAKDIAFPR